MIELRPYQEEAIRKGKIPITEREIQIQIIEYLQRHGFMTLRLNSGFVQTQTGGWMRLSKKGTPDILFFKKMKRGIGEEMLSLFFCEVKIPGKKPTKAQTDMMEELRRYGATVFVASSIEDVEKYI